LKGGDARKKDLSAPLYCQGATTSPKGRVDRGKGEAKVVGLRPAEAESIQKKSEKIQKRSQSVRGIT